MLHQVTNAGGNDPAGATITVSAAIWTAIVSMIIPLLTGLVTKITAHPLVKVIITAILSAISAVVQAATILPDGTAVVSWNTVILAIIQFVGALVSYWAVWNHATAQRQSIDTKLAPRRGIG